MEKLYERLNIRLKEINKKVDTTMNQGRLNRSLLPNEKRLRKSIISQFCLSKQKMN